MAGNINRVVLVGNLTRDPELRHTPSGTPVCSLRLAVNTRRKDETGQWTDKPNYFDITVWGQQGENCAQYLSKGRPVAVDGRLEWREWEAQDGAKRQAVEVVAESVQFLGGRQDGESAATSPRVRPRRRRLPDLARPTTTSRSRRRRYGTEETATPPPHRAGHRPRQAQELPLLPGQGAEIDYKNIAQLRRYISEKGKIRSRRITGACRRHQIQVAAAVKRAREMALLPYVG